MPAFAEVDNERSAGFKPHVAVTSNIRISAAITRAGSLLTWLLCQLVDSCYSVRVSRPLLASTLGARWSLVAVCLGVTGFVLLALSGTELFNDWGKNVSVEIGSTLLLFLPLLFVSQAIERRLARVEDDIEENQKKTASTIANLSEEVSHAIDELHLVKQELSEAVVSKLAEARKNDEDLFRRVEQDPTSETIIEALDRANELGLVSERGPRVLLSNTPIYVRFDMTSYGHPGEGKLILDFNLVLENESGDQLELIPWPHDATTFDILVQLGEKVQAVGMYPGDAIFDPAQIFTDLYALLELTHKRATGASGITEPLGRVVELCPPQWAVTDKDIVCMDGSSPYHITVDRLDEINWRDHMNDKGWVDIGSFSIALDVAMGLYQARQLGLKPPEEPPF